MTSEVSSYGVFPKSDPFLHIPRFLTGDSLDKMFGIDRNALFLDQKVVDIQNGCIGPLRNAYEQLTAQYEEGTLDPEMTGELFRHAYYSPSSGFGGSVLSAAGHAFMRVVDVYLHGPYDDGFGVKGTAQLAYFPSGDDENMGYLDHLALMARIKSLELKANPESVSGFGFDGPEGLEDLALRLGNNLPLF